MSLCAENLDAVAVFPASLNLSRLLSQTRPAEAVTALRGLFPTKMASENACGPLAMDAADRDDVRGTLAGDDTAYERLVGRHQHAIAAYMWRFTRDLRERDELVQDVFVEAYQSLAGFRWRAPLLHWLKRIATRVGYRFWRERERRRQWENPLPEHGTAAPSTENHALAAWEAAELVHYLLARLGKRDRLVLTLFYLEDCTVREVSEMTGWSETMVKVQTHRARRRLARICREMGVEP